MATTPAQQATIDAIQGHKGWSVTNGQGRPDIQKRNVPEMFGDPPKPTGKTIEEEYDTGNLIWDIVSPDGTQVDHITVKPSKPVASGGGPGAYVDPDNPSVAPAVTPAPPVSYTVTQGPSNEQPAPATSSANSANNANEAALNDERSWNAEHTKWGRVTHAEKEALIAKQANTDHQLSQDEIAATRQATADARNANNDARNAQNQANANAIAAGHLAIAQQNAAQGQLTTVKGADGSTNIVRTKTDGTSEVVYTMPAGVKIETTQDGTIIAIDPANPSAPPITIYKPTKPATIVNAPSTQASIVTQNADGTISSQPNPAYTPAAAQRFQELHDGIANIEAMWTRGEITPSEANKYKDLLQQNFDAALKGTTPYQQEQDRAQREQTRMTSGQSLLNQRVSSGSGLAESLLGKAIDIVGNKNFMDPSAVAGFSPFQGAADYVTELGGGQGVYDAATGAVTRGLNGEQQQNDPASVFLQHALNGGGAQPISEHVGSGAANPQNLQNPSTLDPTLLPPSPYSSGGLGPIMAPGVGQPQAPTVFGSTDPGLELLKHALGGRSSGPQYFA